MTLPRLLLVQDEITDFIGRAVSWLCLVMIGVLLIEVVCRTCGNPRPNGRIEVIYQLFPPRGRSLT